MGQELELVEVTSIKFNTLPEITYDIEVENRHRFFANNILAHNCLAQYHPHGDSACYEAIVNSANSPMKLIEGFGNFGTMTDPAAAYRYTNARLSKYADLVFFDKFYLPVIEYVPNYDGSRKEPLVLPTLLPNTILNGNFGIAPGVNTRTPSYTFKSVMKVLREAITAGSSTPKMCMGLEFISKYGGVVHKNKAVRAEMLQFYKTGKGGFTFDSGYSELTVKNTIRIDRFAPIANIERTLAKVEAIKGVSGTRDDGDKSDKYKMAYTVTFAKNLKGTILDGVIAQVMKQFSARVSFSVQATNRVLTPSGDCEAKLFPTTVPELLNLWIAYRIELEKKACTYWIEKRKVELADLALLRLAVKMRDFILKALSKKCSDDELAEYIAKHLKITVVQANRILDLKVRQLRALEDEKLVLKIKDIEKESAGYEARRKAPKKYILKQLDELEKQLS
jgi:DNA gyrase/topoisomerase IV subunit A